MDKDYEHNEGHIEGRCQDMMGCAKDRLYDEKERLVDNAAKAENSMKDKGATMKERMSDAANSAKDKVMRAAHDARDSARETAHKAERAMHNKFN